MRLMGSLLAEGVLPSSHSGAVLNLAHADEAPTGNETLGTERNTGSFCLHEAHIRSQGG